MSIVLITTKENAKRDFANRLHLATDKGVKLVIFVKPKTYNPFKRLRSLYNQVGMRRFIVEIYYAFALRLNPKLRNKLGYFKNYIPQVTSYGWIPETIEVNDVNSGEVQDLLGKLLPLFMVVWDAPIIGENILKNAECVINLHMGVCPHYRGAVANQIAVYNKDFQNIGSTIHYVDGTVDGGGIIKIIKANTKIMPKEMFQELNSKSQEVFLSMALDLYEGKKVNSVPQDMTIGENFKLKNWTPKVRYKTARIIALWEKRSH